MIDNDEEQETVMVSAWHGWGIFAVVFGSALMAIPALLLIWSMYLPIVAVRWAFSLFPRKAVEKSV